VSADRLVGEAQAVTARTAGRGGVEHRPGRREQVAGLLQRGAVFLVLAVAIVAGSVAFGGSFASFENFRNIAISSSFLALIAIGMTFVIIGGGIDLSVGSLLALAGVLAAYGSRQGSLVAILLPLAVCGAIGLVNGLLIARARMAPFIVTLAALLFARGAAFAVSDEGNTTYLIKPGMAVTELGQGTVLGLGVPVLFAIAAFLIGLVVLNRTGYGQAVFAIGGSEDAAQLMGLPVARIEVLVYVASAMLAGFAGILVAARSSSGLPTLGAGLELEAIAAVVIGGTLLSGGAGSLTGTLAGVLLLGVIQNLINQVGTLSSDYQQVVSGAFLVVVVVIQTYLSRRRRL
jgi:ribose/xylose/arabinose/galactoside ABC-type transport system permease subunit